MPATTVAILGGGQLGKMLCMAGVQQGLRFQVLDPAERPPASSCAAHIRSGFDDRDGLVKLAEGASCLTYEFENVPAVSAQFLEGRVSTFPSARALEISQDRFSEKSLFRRLGIPTVQFSPVSSAEDLRRAAQEIGFPSVLKTRTLGYDGKGQVRLSNISDGETAVKTLGSRSLILEQWCAFDYEISIIGVRGQSGEKRFYPPSRNLHHEGILRLSRPLIDPALARQAEALLAAVLDELAYVGVLSLELFVKGDQLIANEMAPRVHNSGHWTIEGSETSQFENHLRACLGWPLGSTRQAAHCLMVNLIGSLPDLRSIRAIPGAHLHLYGKEPRPGRKIGHVTLCAASHQELEERFKSLAALVSLAS